MKTKKILPIAILFISIIFSTSYAIDETELYNSTTNQVQTTSQNQITGTEQPVQTTENTTQQPASNTAINNTSINNTSTTSASQAEKTPSSTVSGVTNISNGSTTTNILSIALIVVGVLLIFLAIAILIRLVQG